MKRHLKFIQNSSYLEIFPKRLIGIYFFDFGGGGGGGGDGDAAAAAASQAAQAQVQAAQIAAQTMMDMYNRTEQKVAPWVEVGEASLNLYASLLGIPGYGPEPTLKPGAVPTGQTPIYGPVPMTAAAPTNLYRDPNTGQVVALTPEQIDFYSRLRAGEPNLSHPASLRDLDYWNYVPLGGGGGPSVPSGPAPITGYTPQYAPEDYITPDIGEYMSNYLRSTPGYGFRMEEGVNALNRSAAARGMLYSGAQQKALTTYGQGLADQTYNALLDRIANLSTGGQNAALQLGGIGATTAQGVAQTQLASGQAQAQGIYNAFQGRQSAYNTGQQNLWGGLGLGTGILSGTGALSGIGAGIGSLFGGVAALTGDAALAASLFGGLGFIGSDKRTKKHIKPLRRDALKKINRLNPVTFQYKDEFGGTRETGYVADEVEKVAPGAIVRGPGGLRMIKPLAMNALLTQAIQEQQQQINALRRAA